MRGPRFTVFIVDDDASVRVGLGRVVRSAGHEVEAFESAEAFLQRKPYDGVGCLLLDLRMPGLNGAALQAELASRGIRLPIVFVTGHGEVPDGVKAIKQGAVDFLTKPVDEEVLLAAIDEALARHRSELAGDEDRASIAARLETLTEREREILRYVISGALNKQTAADLGITEATVKVHRGRVMEKLGAGSVADLVRLCDAVGLAPIPPGGGTPKVE